jgi:hypothetical protein
MVAGSPQPVPLTFFVPGYFQAIGTRIVGGHDFRDREPAPAPRPVLVSAALSRRLFGDAPAIGRTLDRLEDDGRPIRTGPERRDIRPPFTIVGIVDDVRGESLRTGPAEVLYVPLIEPVVETQIVPTDMTVVIRAADARLDLVAAIREAVSDTNPRLSVGRTRHLDSIVHSARAEEAFAGALLSTAALIAWTLGVIGVYGSVAQQVRRRRREVGVRLALGASRASVLRLVTAAALRSAGAGTATGVMAALAGAHLIGSLLFDVEPRDPKTLAIVSVMLLVSASLAAIAAGLHGTQVSPVTALRSE